MAAAIAQRQVQGRSPDDSTGSEVGAVFNGDDNVSDSGSSQGSRRRKRTSSQMLVSTEASSEPISSPSKRSRLKAEKSKAKFGKSCICASTGDASLQNPDFMIECNGCQVWFHGECIGITAKQADAYEEYFCKNCFPLHGLPTRKLRTNIHRHNAYEKNADLRKVQSGTTKFLDILKRRSFAPVEEIVVVKKGYDVTIDMLQELGFDRPILIRDRGGLDVVIPEKPFIYDDVVRILGESRQVLAIDVPTQEDGVQLTLGEYLSYMKTSVPRETVLNIISLEFSNTELSKMIIPPMIVRELSWADRFFPDELPPESPYGKPEVQKYCLMSAQDSYTDFHIDFGGTSVWYHIYKGRKVFYLIAPTERNLTVYENWMKSKDQTERFLGDEARCYKLELTEGQTVLLPSGWIHAVYTPEDSLVFGGNFLHHLAVENQLRINRMEDRLKTPDRYRYPHFFTACWYALNDLTEIVADYVEERKKPPKWASNGAKFLYQELREWMNEDEIAKAKRHSIPETVNAKDVMRRLAGFFKKLDVQL